MKKTLFLLLMTIGSASYSHLALAAEAGDDDEGIERTLQDNKWVQDATFIRIMMEDPTRIGKSIRHYRAQSPTHTFNGYQAQFFKDLSSALGDEIALTFIDSIMQSGVIERAGNLIEEEGKNFIKALLADRTLLLPHIREYKSHHPTHPLACCKENILNVFLPNKVGYQLTVFLKNDIVASRVIEQAWEITEEEERIAAETLATQQMEKQKEERIAAETLATQQMEKQKKEQLRQTKMIFFSALLLLAAWKLQKVLSQN
jgi:hypothetical protein